MKNFNPKLGNTFTNKAGLINELVGFIPDVTIECLPPIKKGIPDVSWVKYRKGHRPNTKNQWENALGLSIQTML